MLHKNSFTQHHCQNVNVTYTKEGSALGGGRSQTNDRSQRRSVFVYVDCGQTMNKLSYFEIVSSNLPLTVTVDMINLHTSKMLSRRYDGTERGQVTVVAPAIH